MTSDDFSLPFGLRDATTAAASVRDGEVSAAVLLDTLLDRLPAADSVTNAVVVTCVDRARREARRVDDGEQGGPLAGVPITVKEAFHTEGMPTTWGLPDSAGWVAAADAIVVQRLRAAGAILYGKTNVATMLADFAQSTNDVYGRTTNPFDASRAPGGSSGGSASAVAAGLTFLDFGSDLAGSIRIPAACCGVYGLRPTENTIDAGGFAPAGAPPTPVDAEVGWVSTVGPVARTPADLRTALSVTRNVTAREPRQPVAVRGLRLGVVLDDELCPPASDVGAVLSDAVDRLAAAGVELRSGWPDGVDAPRGLECFGFALQRFLGTADPSVQWHATGDELAEHVRLGRALRAAWADYFVDVDAFLCPVNFTVAVEHDDRPFDERVVRTVDGERRYDEQSFWTAHAAAVGLPALSAPTGRTVAGLPVGLQLIGPHGGDDQIIDVAELCADVLR